MKYVSVDVEFDIVSYITGKFCASLKKPLTLRLHSNEQKTPFFCMF